MINARSETASTKPAFRDPLKFRRCLIPADGFYEWMRTAKAKQPYCFEVNGGELFAFAGLWDRWKDPTGDWIKTCSILTTTPNAVTCNVHDRMPVILDPEGYDLWLDPGMRDATAASELLKPYDARMMRCFPVSRRVNQVGNDDATTGLGRRGTAPPRRYCNFPFTFLQMYPVLAHGLSDSSSTLLPNFTRSSKVGPLFALASAAALSRAMA